MAKKTRKTLPSYMKEMDKDGNTVSTVSVRMDAKLKARFYAGVELARKHNIELTLSEVVRDAVERACHDLEAYTGELIGQQELPMGDGKSDKA